MADKHLFKVNKRPTNEEFLSDTWTSRLDYVGLVKKDGGGVNANEVFYNFTGTKITKLKVRIEKPGDYGLGFIDGCISTDKPTIIDWGNETTTTLTRPITNKEQLENSIDYYTHYSKSGEYIISIDGWYNFFQCFIFPTIKSGATQISEVLTEIIQVSSLITRFTSTFYNCSNLTSIPSGLFDNNTNATSFTTTFSNCKNLASIPPSLFDKNTSVTRFDNTFRNCSNLTSIPSGLFDKNANATNFYRTFYDCYNLTGETPYTLSSDGVTKIKLWNRDGTNGFAKPTSTNEAFFGCTNLTDFGAIPSGWK